MKTPGTLFIVTAASGTGKTSLVRELVAEVENIIVSISYTTRSKRVNEQHGINYFFTDKSHFETMIMQGLFLEHANVYGEYYGTQQAWVVQQLAAGFDVILEIDWQGAQQVKHLMPTATSIFILPPSIAELQKRLELRGSDKPESIERRLKNARDEIAQCLTFDYLLINDNFSHALADLKAIVYSHRLRVDKQSERCAAVLTQLLS